MHVVTLGSFPLTVSVHVLVSLRSQGYGCGFVATPLVPGAWCAESIFQGAGVL